jgi:signal transduction histidine kinase
VSDGTLRRQLQLRRKDGALVWVDVFTVKLSATRSFSILSDITPLKQAEEARVRGAELEAQNLALGEAARLKNEFLANMSHELRTPLNAVIGFTHLLQMQPAALDEARRTRYVQQIADSGQHLLALVQAMLDFAQTEAGKLPLQTEAIAVRTALQEVADMLQADPAHPGTMIDIQVAAGLDAVHTDPLRLRQMLLGLAHNAVKFSPAGAPVALRAQGVGADHWRVEVEDHGIGIRADDLGRLFQFFTPLEEGRTKAHGGTGLGLALVRQLARAAGGDVTVRSEFGVGSVFTLTLPRALGRRTA